MIDTHAHLFYKNYDKDRSEVIARTKASLDAVINIAIDEATGRLSVQLAESNKEFFAVVGFAPESVVKLLEIGSMKDILNKLNKLIDSSKKVVAIGEIGLDYYWEHISSKSQRELQELGFRAQIELAIERRLPIVVHSRNAYADTINILREYVKSSIIGVWHSFTEGWPRMQEVVKLGLKIGINGIVTYPSATKLQEAVSHVSLGSLVLETDSPFLAPQSIRGKRNEPVYVREVAERIAELKRIDLKRVDVSTTTNAIELFRLDIM